MKILVMGGTRFVGKSLVGKLLSKNYDIDIFTRGNKSNPEKTNLIKGDRNNSEDIVKLRNKNYDFVYDISGRELEQTKLLVENLDNSFQRYIYVSSAGVYKDNSESIHENNFVKIPVDWKNEKLNEKWSNLFKIKQEANIAIEEKRANKEIGSSLEAEIKLILKKDKFELLDKLDLADYFIVSKAEKELSNNGDIKIEVKKAQGQKCERCWKILEKKCERESCPIK